MDSASFSFESFFNHCLWYMLDNSVDVYGDKLKMRYDRSDINPEDLKYLESILYVWYYNNISTISSVNEKLTRPIEVSVVAEHLISFVNYSSEFPTSLYGNKNSESLCSNTNMLPTKSLHFSIPVEGKLYLLRSY